MIRVDFYPNPLDRKACLRAEVAGGQTINEILGGDYRDRISVLSNGHIVPKTFYASVRFKPDTHLEVMPAANGIETGALIAGAIGLGAGTTAAVAVTIAINVLAGLAVGLLSSLLFAPKIPKPGSASAGFDSLNQFTGTANQIASFTPIPILFGRHRFYPVIPVSAKPYTEQLGDQQYLRMLFVLSHGKMAIGGHTVGQGHARITQDTALSKDADGKYPIAIAATGIDEYEDVEYEIGTSDQMRLYSDQVIENDPQWSTESDIHGQAIPDDQGLIYPDAPTIRDDQSTTRTSETNASEISIDLRGTLYSVNGKGDFSGLRVTYKIEWRKSASSDAWRSDTFLIADNDGKTSTKSYRIKNLDDESSYDVRLTRVKTKFDDDEGPPSSKVDWVALRTIRQRRAFAVPDTVVMAIRIRATDQLKGQLDKLSIEGTSVLPVFDTTANSWVDQPTRNPAWAFAEVLTGSANRSPISKTSIDINELVAWAHDCAQYDLNFDVVYDTQQTTIDRLKEITSVGRAAFSINSDNDISVIRDIPHAVPRMVISPRNSFGYSYTLSAFNPPQAIKVRYKDAANNYETAERVVYDDGEDSSTALKTTAIQSVGCTSAEQAYKFGRYHLANQRLRGIEVHQFSMDVAHLHFVRGDTVTLQNDQILVGLAAGRVTGITRNASGRITGFQSDEFLPMASANYACKFQQFDGTIFVAPVKTNPGHAVEFVSPLDKTIELDEHFVFGETGRISTDLKITKIEKKNDLQAAITCEPAAPNILDGIDGPIPEFNPNITQPIDPQNYPPPVPTIVSVVSDSSVAIQNDDGSLIWRVAVTVTANSGPVSTDHIQVGVRRSGATGNTYSGQNAIDGVAYFTGYNPGDQVDIRARAISNTRQPSQYVIQSGYTVTGRVPLTPAGINVTPHTFTADLAAIGQLGQQYEYFISGVELTLSEVLASASRVNQNAASTAVANGLQPDTDYWAYARAVNIYAQSSFVGATFRTRNDASALLKAINGKLDQTALVAALSGKIDQIQPPAAIQDIITARLSDEQLARLADIQSEADARAAGDTQTYSDAQSYADTDSQAATTVNQVVASFGGNAANALNYAISQTDADLSITQQFNSIKADYQNINTAQIDANSTAIADATGSYATLAQSLNTRFGGQADAINSKASVDDITSAVATETNARTQQYRSLDASLKNKAGLDASGRIVENGEVAINAAHGPFAQATKQVTVSDGDATATLEQQFTAQRTAIGTLQATYTLKVQGTTAAGDPVFGSIGLSAEETGSKLILSADDLAFGKVGQTGIDYPFYFDSSAGLALLKEANIGSLTFTKLRDSSGNFLVDSQGRIKAQYISVDNLQVNYSAVFGPKPPVDADHTASNTARDTTRVNGRSAANVLSGIDYSYAQLVKGADNKISKPTFDDETTGTWTSNVTDGKGNLRLSARDTIENTPFEVTPNETLYFQASIYSVGTTNTVRFGIVDSAGYQPACSLPGGQQRTVITGSLGVPDGVTSAKAWLQIQATSDFGQAFVRELFIGRFEPGSNVTETRTSSDVLTGDGKAVREAGADRTGSNTANDTTSVAGRSANTVRDEARDGKNADQRTAAWARANNATLIDGRKIFTGDAYVDTVVIAGEAVTLTDQVVDERKIIGSTDGSADYRSYEWTRLIGYNAYNVQNTRSQVVGSFAYQGNNDNDMDMTVRLLRRPIGDFTRNIVVQQISANHVGGGADNQYMGGTFCYPFVDSGLTIGVDYYYVLEIRISAGTLKSTDHTLAYMALKR